MKTPKRLIPFLTLTLALGVSLLPQPALAADAAVVYHAEELNDSGVDVAAVQLFLVERGHSVAVSSVFDSATATAVGTFQRAVGLSQSQKVDSATWKKLIKTIKPGDSGAAVRALQLQLNAKRFANLSTSATYDAATTQAVKEFQAHMSLRQTGKMDLSTWKTLLWHYQQLPLSNSVCGYKDQPERTWGTGDVIGGIGLVAKELRDESGPLSIGDISLEHGGDIDRHHTHELGLAADFRPIRVDRQQCNQRTTIFDAQYDRNATRAVIKKLRETGNIHHILFNDPTLIAEGLTKSYPNHDNHFHVVWNA